VASLQQLLRLFAYDLTPFFIEFSPSLANRSNLGVYGKMMTQEVRVYARHVRGRPRESVKVPRYDLSNLILRHLAQISAKFEHLPTDLSFYYVSSGFGLFLPGDLCTGDPFFPQRLGRNSEHPLLVLRLFS